MDSELVNQVLTLWTSKLLASFTMSQKSKFVVSVLKKMIEQNSRAEMMFCWGGGGG